MNLRIASAIVLVQLSGVTVVDRKSISRCHLEKKKLFGDLTQPLDLLLIFVYFLYSIGL